jgi:1-acyl-sn-glycerol-3-phosphate acyltransferase
MQNWWKLPYSIYAIILIFVLFLLVLPIYVLIKIFLPYSKQMLGVHSTNKIVFLVWSAFTGFRYKITGVENIDDNQTYVVICNHNNLADFMASAYGIQVPAKPLIKKELLNIPIIGQLFAMASVPLDRKDDDARKKSLEVMIKELEQNISLIIFPEGTRNRTPQPLKEFHNGAFIISMKSGKPILPVVFTNMKNLSPAESLLIRPWRIEANHLAPIFPDAFQDVQEFKDHVYRIMWNYLVENDKSYKSFEKL